jgi:hypothetical protein
MSNLGVNPRMDHPFISDLSEKTTDQLLESINSIDSKISFAMQMNNRNLVNQLYMAKNNYQNMYNKKMAELFEKMNVTSGVNITKKT